MHKTKGIVSSFMASLKMCYDRLIFASKNDCLYHDVFDTIGLMTSMQTLGGNVIWIGKISGDKKLLEDLSFQAKSGDYSFVTQIIVTPKWVFHDSSVRE